MGISQQQRPPIGVLIPALHDEGAQLRREPQRDGAPVPVRHLQDRQNSGLIALVALTLLKIIRRCIAVCAPDRGATLLADAPKDLGAHHRRRSAGGHRNRQAASVAISLQLHGGRLCWATQSRRWRPQLSSAALVIGVGFGV